MASSVRLEIITPSKKFYQGDVELVIVRTLEGDEGFMKGHAWACKLLDIGEMWIQEKGAAKNSYKVAAIAGGFIDVKDTIIIYTDAVEWAEDIDMERVTPRNLVLKNGCGIMKQTVHRTRSFVPEHPSRKQNCEQMLPVAEDVENTKGAPRGASMTPCRATNKGAHYG